MSDSESEANAVEMNAALSKFKAASSRLSGATVALFRGAFHLVGALVHDGMSLFPKAGGNLVDHGRVLAYYTTEKQVESCFLLVEELTGITLPKTKETAKNVFSKFFGLSPLDTSVLLTAMIGLGVYGAVAKQFDNTVVKDFTATLGRGLPESSLFFSNHSIVISLLAVVFLSAVRVGIHYRPMAMAAGFEMTRQAWSDKMEHQRHRAIIGGWYERRRYRKTSAKYQSKFDESKKLSDGTLADIISIRSAGDGDSAIYERIAQSVEELHWSKPIYSRLVDEYCMPAPKAASVAHSIIIEMKGDLPLIKKRLQSHVLPADWVSSYGFDPRTVVGETRIKDRRSKLLRLCSEIRLSARYCCIARR
ncbi:hypothetical protein [Pseudomonas sp.]|uniref:hypothetical protein n=1 Tax=Pseudomonas sp. TaxID=306 RepID=UPI002908EB70|nr:hypothetical protein [Pseudomonas sp.]MDU4254415.1 hypothetical protein [Pseudomonas sp.]